MMNVLSCTLNAAFQLISFLVTLMLIGAGVGALILLGVIVYSFVEESKNAGKHK